MASDMNKSKRQSCSGAGITAGSAKILSQVTSCGGIFDVGSPPLIHGKITTLPSNCDKTRQARGSLMAIHSRNGKHQDQVPSYGYMGNVSCHPALTLSQRLMVLPFVAGCGKSVLWYVNCPIFSY